MVNSWKWKNTPWDWLTTYLTEHWSIEQSLGEVWVSIIQLLTNYWVRICQKTPVSPSTPYTTFWSTTKHKAQHDIVFKVATDAWIIQRFLEGGQAWSSSVMMGQYLFSNYSGPRPGKIFCSLQDRQLHWFLGGWLIIGW